MPKQSQWQKESLGFVEKEIDGRHILLSTQVEQNSFSPSFSFLTSHPYFFFFSFVNLIFTGVLKILVIDFTVIMKLINAQSLCHLPFKITLWKEEKLLKESSDAHECWFLIYLYHTSISNLLLKVLNAFISSSIHKLKLRTFVCQALCMRPVIKKMNNTCSQGVFYSLGTLVKDQVMMKLG